MASGPVHAADRTLAILPIHAEGMGTETAEIGHNTLKEAVAGLETTVLPEEEVRAHLTGHCDDPPC
jgi:hypothetical protein